MPAPKPKPITVPNGQEAIFYDPNDLSSLQAARRLLSDKIADLQQYQARQEEEKPSAEAPKA